ncbi:basic salivary proline-rich protein 1-like [Corvus hawaiiensis]|uniref:basic salivary proline-rich protein 1-like n=1 Tax=Corvus hawaiiensis TaxID=134902 RepID=UPI002019AFD9|nr:basic salivary proline-rich protein 1-like [Corvus hawaiiensis]
MPRPEVMLPHPWGPANATQGSLLAGNFPASAWAAGRSGAGCQPSPPSARASARSQEPAAPAAVPARSGQDAHGTTRPRELREPRHRGEQEPRWGHQSAGTVPKGDARWGQSIGTPKSPRERRAGLPRESRVGLWASPQGGIATPTSTVPARGTSRDTPGAGGGSVTLSPALHPGQTPGNSSRRLKSALPRLGGLAQLPGRDPPAAPVPRLGDSCCQPGAVRMPEAEPGGNPAGNVRLGPSVSGREGGPLYDRRENPLWPSWIPAPSPGLPEPTQDPPVTIPDPPGIPPVTPAGLPETPQTTSSIPCDPSEPPKNPLCPRPRTPGVSQGRSRPRPPPPTPTAPVTPAPGPPHNHAPAPWPPTRPRPPPHGPAHRPTAPPTAPRPRPPPRGHAHTATPTPTRPRPRPARPARPLPDAPGIHVSHSSL